MPMPSACPECKTEGALTPVGPGVERVAEEAAARAAIDEAQAVVDMADKTLEEARLAMLAVPEGSEERRILYARLGEATREQANRVQQLNLKLYYTTYPFPSGEELAGLPRLPLLRRVCILCGISLAGTAAHTIMELVRSTGAAAVGGGGGDDLLFWKFNKFLKRKN